MGVREAVEPGAQRVCGHAGKPEAAGEAAVPGDGADLSGKGPHMAALEAVRERDQQVAASKGAPTSVCCAKGHA